MQLTLLHPLGVLVAMTENNGKEHTSQPNYAGMKLRWSLLLLVVVTTFIYTNVSSTPKSAATGDLAIASAELVAHTESAPKPVASPAALGETLSETLPETLPETSPAASPEPRAASKFGPATPASDAPASGVAKKQTIAAADEQIRRHKVKSGDTISSLLRRNGVGAAMGDLLPLNKTAPALFALDRGDTVELVIRNGRLHSLKREPDRKTEILALLKNGRYTVEQRQKETTIRQSFATGVVSDSFYVAGIRAGLSDKIIINAVNILGWDIDFVFDVRKGDSFAVVYNEEWLEGEKLGDREIVAIEYVNRGKTYRATRYTDSAGDTDYYTPEGKSVRRPFIRTPLEYTRISSRFNPRRLHPILKVRRPHRGVDYAAPTGTPIYSTGDGKIIFRGWKKGYGRVVIVQHGHRYKTLYAHLSKFAPKQRVGGSVKQRQVIGYVGQTGYATGPHLHYEFRVNDVHKNPLTVKLPDSVEPLRKRELAQFKTHARPAWKTLDTLSRRQLAADK